MKIKVVCQKCGKIGIVNTLYPPDNEFRVFKIREERYRGWRDEWEIWLCVECAESFGE